MTNLYPWLVEPYQKVIQSFRQGQGHHALLFKSESGLGIEQLIEAIASVLICQSQQDMHSCGQCHSCHLFRAGSHPDFYRLTPIDNKDIGVEQVREINEKVAQHAQQNGNKVVYVQGAERLTEAAANALLKTLEEPRPYTYFLLQTELSATLLPTIHSRCQRWVVNTPPYEQSLTWLQQQCSADCSADITDIQTALRVSYGRPFVALGMLTQGLLEKRKSFLRQFWLFYTRRSPMELLPYFESELVFQQLDWLSAFLIDALKDKLAIQQGWVCEDLIRGVQQFNTKQTALGLLKANQIIQKVRWDLAEINGVNQELILLEGLTRLITEVFDV